MTKSTPQASTSSSVQLGEDPRWLAIAIHRLGSHGPEFESATAAAISMYGRTSRKRRSKAAHAHIAEGARLFALAGRPTKAQFIRVYGPNGPKMTWEQRAEAGVDAKRFQAALAAKGGA